MLTDLKRLEYVVELKKNTEKIKWFKYRIVQCTYVTLCTVVSCAWMWVRTHQYSHSKILFSTSNLEGYNRAVSLTGQVPAVWSGHCWKSPRALWENKYWSRIFHLAFVVGMWPSRSRKLAMSVITEPKMLGVSEHEELLIFILWNREKWGW